MIAARQAGIAGMVGAVLFPVIITFLTIAQYDFMRSLGWHPTVASEIPWPSALALGPYGWLQVFNFIIFGFAIMALAVGLQRSVSRGQGSKVGPVLLFLAGVGVVLCAFKVDLATSTSPLSIAGLLHIVGFLMMSFMMLLSLFFLAARLGKDPAWQGYGRYTFFTATAALLAFLSTFFFPGVIGFAVFLLIELVWFVVVGNRLRELSSTATGTLNSPPAAA